MWRSPYLSSTSLVLLLLAGCNGDDDCGTMGAAADGLTASSVDVTLTFGQMISRAGSDCPDPATPDIIAVTVEGRQTDGTGFITLCIPRPDLLEMGNRTLGHTTSTADIRIIDLDGAANNCTYKIDKTRVPTGMGAGMGVCDNGTNSAGFALVLDGAVSLTRTCGATVDTIGVKLSGTFAVPAEPSRR